MKIIFKDYLDIFEKYPKDEYLTREERKERYKLLQEYEKKDYQDEINIDEFSEVSKKLRKDNEEYIEECRVYYNAWFDFLDNKDKYKSYKEYLEKNNIEY